MSLLLQRRRFLKSCAAGAMSLAGLDQFAGFASATNLQVSAGTGFSGNDLRILRGATQYLARYITHAEILRGAYATAQRSLIDNNYCRAVGLPQRSDWSWSCLSYQVNYYLSRYTPRVVLQPYYRRDNYWAYAHIGTVRTLNITQRTGQVSGDFLLYVNRFWLGNGWGADPGIWAGVLAHEMMHNLGHIHGNNEYGSHLQINALQQCIQRATAPDNGRLSDSDEEFSEAKPFCGCGSS